jgi:AcrR family transcriptional regulator
MMLAAPLANPNPYVYAIYMPDDVYDVNTPRAYHHGDLRRALVEAGFEILESEGREALTLRSVSDRTGVSKMAPYRHFADKSALLTAIGQHGFVLLRDRLKQSDRRDDPCQALVDLAAAHIEFALEHPALFRLMFGPDPQIGADRADIVNDPDTAFGILARRIREVFPRAEIELATLSCWSFVHGLATLAIDRRLRPAPGDIKAVTRHAAAFLIGRLTDSPRAMER